jgi:hypothetical protein
MLAFPRRVFSAHSRATRADLKDEADRQRFVETLAEACA